MNEPPEASRATLQAVHHGFNGAMSGKLTMVAPGKFDDPNEVFEVAKWWCDTYPQIGVKVRKTGRNIVFEPAE